jgi:hypothetical protein
MLRRAGEKCETRRSSDDSGVAVGTPATISIPQQPPPRNSKSSQHSKSSPPPTTTKSTPHTPRRRSAQHLLYPTTVYLPPLFARGSARPAARPNRQAQPPTRKYRNHGLRYIAGPGHEEATDGTIHAARCQRSPGLDRRHTGRAPAAG